MNWRRDHLSLTIVAQKVHSVHSYVKQDNQVNYLNVKSPLFISKFELHFEFKIYIVVLT